MLYRISAKAQAEAVGRAWARESLEALDEELRSLSKALPPWQDPGDRLPPGQELTEDEADEVEEEGEEP